MATYGKGSYGGVNLIGACEGKKCTVGNYCSLADGITVFLGANHRVDWISTYPFPSFTEKWSRATGITEHPSSKGDVIIGNDVWIGSFVTILSGVKIGDGAVIGACTVVSQNVPPYAIFVGNPGMVVRYRFSDGQIEKLLKIKWWNWDEDKINENIPLLCSQKIQEFIDRNL